MGGGLLSVPMDAEVELGFQECHKLQMRQGKQNLKKKNYRIHPLAQSCDCNATPPPNSGLYCFKAYWCRQRHITHLVITGLTVFDTQRVGGLLLLLMLLLLF